MSAVPRSGTTFVSKTSSSLYGALTPRDPLREPYSGDKTTARVQQDRDHRYYMSVSANPTTHRAPAPRSDAAPHVNAFDQSLYPGPHFSSLSSAHFTHNHSHDFPFVNNARPTPDYVNWSSPQTRTSPWVTGSPASASSSGTTPSSSPSPTPSHRGASPYAPTTTLAGSMQTMYLTPPQIVWCDGVMMHKDDLLVEGGNSVWHHVGAGDKQEICCRWEGCGTKLKKESLARHILSTHLSIKSACSNCRTELARDDAWRRHVQRIDACRIANARVTTVHGPNARVVNIPSIAG
ncbi:hypothetical protein BV22DRAFT_1051291 [Leucogyrophana mollusca]|uniref:Uncharacterized protein n=1 Tax=Leucogyrophana mollusca TaxID=85980 RepID=A0ACB8AZU1_9AGAM|nr:hypothetical protein BV22DRAFT_1051291 [Leucogyrophana mollusca]